MDDVFTALAKQQGILQPVKDTSYSSWLLIGGLIVLIVFLIKSKVVLHK